MFNRVILIGNLTKDPEVRYTQGGTPVTTMRLAVTSKYKQGDETKDDTLFIDSVVFGRQAETCGQYLSKGSPVLVEGRLRERRWEQEGVQKSKTEVIANSVRFMPRKDTKAAPADSFGSGETSAAPDEITDVEPF
ncbi:MAG: single-stranded DNA-binding protein [Dissulfurispiraceae bacterium]|jgi:single-strand DNA-binding protein|nr:single-stranded DNA-binding protein [Dissulfurispiraceae bacterium]